MLQNILITCIFLISGISYASHFDYTVSKQTKNNITSLKINLNINSNIKIYTDNLFIKKNNKKYDLKIHPKKITFDPFSKKYKYIISNKASLTTEFKALADSPINTLEMHYQACTKKVCYLPQVINLDLQKRNTNNYKSLEFYLNKNFWLALLIVFLSGFLTSLTPCIAPLIPITISVFKKTSSSKTTLIMSSLTYILGLAITFSALGLLSISSSSVLGRIFNSAYSVF